MTGCFQELIKVMCNKKVVRQANTNPFTIKTKVVLQMQFIYGSEISTSTANIKHVKYMKTTLYYPSLSEIFKIILYQYTPWPRKFFIIVWENHNGK